MGEYGLRELKLREEYLNRLKNGVPSRREISPRENYELDSLLNIGIPRLYQDVIFEDFEFSNTKSGKIAKEVISNYLDNLHDVFDSCVNLLIYGKNGCGKTYTASLIIKRAFEFYYTSRLFNYATIINNVYSKVDNAEDYATYEFLCIDEVGKETQVQSKSNIFLLEQILRLRDQKGLPTIVCTNLDYEQFKSTYGDSITSLLSQGAMIQMEGKDRRGEVIVNRDGFRKVMGWED